MENEQEVGRKYNEGEEKGENGGSCKRIARKCMEKKERGRKESYRIGRRCKNEE